VHTWDLAKAVSIEAELDRELCARAYASRREADLSAHSDMYAPPVAVDPGAGTETLLIALWGRDPAWAAP